VNLASQTVPSVGENSAAVRSPDDLRVLHRLPRYLRESLAEHGLSALHCPESVLLAVTRVPNPVHEYVGGVEEAESPLVPLVLVGVVVGEVDGAVAVGKGNAG